MNNASATLDELNNGGAKRALGAARDQVSDTLKNAAAATDDYVREYPWAAVGIAAGIAAGVGFLAGRLLSERR